MSQVTARTVSEMDGRRALSHFPLPVNLYRNLKFQQWLQFTSVRLSVPQKGIFFLFWNGEVKGRSTLIKGFSQHEL